MLWRDNGAVMACFELHVLCEFIMWISGGSTKTSWHDRSSIVLRLLLASLVSSNRIVAWHMLFFLLYIVNFPFIAVAVDVVVCVVEAITHVLWKCDILSFIMYSCRIIAVGSVCFIPEWVEFSFWVFDVQSIRNACNLMRNRNDGHDVEVGRCHAPALCYCIMYDITNMKHANSNMYLLGRSRESRRKK